MWTAINVSGHSHVRATTVPVMSQQVSTILFVLYEGGIADVEGAERDRHSLGETNNRTRQTSTVTPAGLADAACLCGCLPA